MDDKLNQPDIQEPTKSEWIKQKCRIHSTNSKLTTGYLKIAKEVVTCTGSKDDPETLLDAYHYEGKDGTRYAVFECIGGESKGWVMCVVNENQLSARKKTKEYIKFKDAAEAVLFSVVTPDKRFSQFQIKWVKKDDYIGFDKEGQPLTIGEVSKLEPESLFTADEV